MLHSTLSLPSFRNSKTHYEKLKTFERLYFEQSEFIDRVMGDWPRGREEGEKITLNKLEYHRLVKEGKTLREGCLYCVCEQGLGAVGRRISLLLRDNMKICLMDRP